MAGFFERLLSPKNGDEDIHEQAKYALSQLTKKEIDKELLFLALKHLNDREKEIVRLRFGLNGVREKTQKEVADILGISQSYISRLEKKIMKRLKKEIAKYE